MLEAFFWFQVWLGPNAVLAFKREGYSWFDVSFKDLAEVLKYPGFYKLGMKYLSYGTRHILGSIFIGMAGKAHFLVHFYAFYSVSSTIYSAGTPKIRAGSDCKGYFTRLYGSSSHGHVR